MKLSRFGTKISSDAAIVDLMQDLGDALNVNPDLLFLGGGNPAKIPAFEERVATHLQAIAADPLELHKLIGVYQSPKGSEYFIDALAEHLNAQLGWNISSNNIAVTNGSQSAFFILLNLFSGGGGLDGERQQVVFPMMPEYLGYSDQPSEIESFRSCRPVIKLTAENRFKYQVDFSVLSLGDADGALCISRPTNPTGNVISEEELRRLSDMAQAQGIPFIIDCAYGDPFPGILYSPQPLPYHDNNIYVLSCSKLGLPGVRTGIVVAKENVIDQLVKANTVISLANGNLGPALMTSLLQNDNLSGICRDLLLPFYLRRRDFAIQCIEKHFSGIRYRIHEAEGAFFLWLWFPELPITSTEFYERMKNKGVLIMDGAHFFFGIDDGWEHAKQCVRLTYCQSEEVIETAIGLMGEELRALG